MSALRRVPVDDELLLGDELVLLLGQRVVLLSPLASYALGRLGGDWTEIVDLGAHLVAAYGDPGDDTALTDLVDALTAEGLVEVRT